MAEWLFERGIGESRAALVEDGRIVEARIQVESSYPRVGAVHATVLGEDWRDRRVVALEPPAGDAFLDRVYGQVPLGSHIRVEVTRERIRTPRETKLPHVRHLPVCTERRQGTSLSEEIAATGIPVTALRLHEEDRLEAAGWSEVLEAAASGRFVFSHGVLHIELTRTMTLIDVDGGGPLDRLAVAAAGAAARAIRLFDLTGSIGIDFPSVSGAARKAVAEAFDAEFPHDCERTAVNGFGFMQVVRQKRRASLLELLQGDPVGAEARALLRRAERSGLTGAIRLLAHPAVIGRIKASPSWTDVLATTCGGAVTLREDAALAISGGHASKA